MKFSDDTLIAYLEGKLDEDAANALETAVAEDSGLEARLMALDPFAPVVKGVFEDLPAKAPNVVLPSSDVRGHNPLRLLAVAASVAVVAVSATYWAMRPTPLGWTEQAAIYQSLYVPETIAALDNSPQALDAQFAQAEAQLGRSLNREVLESIPGLDLKRAQVLAFNGKPLVQIVFADERGLPLAFCVIRQGDGAPEKDVNSTVLSGLATAAWSKDGYGYMLIGSDEQTDLTANIDLLTGAFTG